MSRRSFALVAAVAALLLGPADVVASTTQESVLQDDNQLVYSSPQHVERVLDQLVSLGVDRVRVSVLWAALAPGALSSHRPRFDAADPAAYPAAAWAPYDNLVRLAQERGIGVDLNPTAPAPYWAASARAPSSSFRNTYSPSPSEFGKFIEALGRRYSGRYLPPDGAPPTGGGGGSFTPTGSGGSPVLPSGSALPRVSYWSVWNEPDQGGWLTPQWRQVSKGKWVPGAAPLYRRLLDAAWRALMRSGHQGDTILIGETAANGFTVPCTGCSMRPIPFIKSLYCVDDSYRPLRGATATLVGCPSAPDPGAFVAAHPALFEATGFAHHPYSFFTPPDQRSSDRNLAPLADLSRLESALDRAFAAYGQQIPGGIPLYLTEYGYKSRPPNPYAPFTDRQQAAFINEGEYMAYRDPRVRAFGQFLLVDDKPKASAQPGSRSYWSTFQTGLIGLGGGHKPAYQAYQLAIWLPKATHGPSVIVWGHLRVAPRDTSQTATIEFMPSGAGVFSVLSLVSTDNPRGFLEAQIAIPSPGLLRISWQDPVSGVTYRSRSARVS